jgi:outer membrane protein TolC
LRISFALLLSLSLNAASGFAATGPMDFKTALGLLSQRNLDIQTQKAELKKSEAQKLNSQSAFLPTLNAKGIDNQVEVPPFARTQQGLLVGNINLFRSGADLASVKSTSAAVRRERYELTQVELEAEQSDITLLVRYIQTSQQLKVAETILKLNEELSQIEEARYRRGLIPLQESQKAVIERSNSLARFQDAKARHEEARATLLTSLGQSDIEQEWPWKSFLAMTAVEKWMKQNLDLQKTPAWQAGLESVESENQAKKAQFREYLPSLDLNVGYGYLDYLNTKDTGWQTTLTLTIPLVDLQKHSQYRIQAQQEMIARLNLEKTKRSLLSGWQATKEKLFLALKSAKEREESKKMAQSLYQDNQRRLRAGRSNINDVVVDQNRLGDAETLAINGWAEAHMLYAQLCHTLGLRVNLGEFGCGR